MVKEAESPATMSPREQSGTPPGSSSQPEVVASIEATPPAKELMTTTLRAASGPAFSTLTL